MSVQWSSGTAPSLYREWQVAGLVFRRSRRLGRLLIAISVKVFFLDGRKKKQGQ